MPKPSPLLAPFTNPAMSTISTVAGKTRSGFTNSSNFSNRGSGTFTTPKLGSMVQNGKFALCAFAFDKQLNKVDFPTLGSPTIPAFILCLSVLQPFDDLKYSFLAVLLFTKIPAKVRKNLETQKSKTNIRDKRIFKIF
ncbi:Hypothetical protein Ccan_14330 [Capnocytophaga canimorsus Cc5]|uniref:Uncharacterized protein n=1 Tax=Capnocytophaga canimorsus (strain 5) TaxID=860228 RepID=F9YQL0_CAPCC|nr:Hypothetical protein Ccan_14330 [Capnocytophaga canimorsus Cc5]